MDPRFKEMMSLENEEDEFDVGRTYRIRDKIENFRIRVRIRRISRDPFIVSEEESDNDVGDDEEDIRESYLEDVTIRWQQKIFCQREIDEYRSAKLEDFAEDQVLSKKFYHDVANMEEVHNRIFTVINGELKEDFFLSDKGEPNYLSMMMANGLRHRLHKQVDTQDSMPTTKNNNNNNILIQNPSRETQLRLHTLDVASSYGMIIKFETDNGELRLCTLKLRSNILEVLPDFSYNKPYKLEVDGKPCYEYWLEHASEAMAYEDQVKEMLMMNQLMSHRASLLASEVGMDFERPQSSSSRAFRLFINVEIVSAYDYDYDNLFIHYFVDVPSAWKPSRKEDNQFQGMTQTCMKNSKGIAYFAFTFTIDICFDINRLDYADCKWPQIYFEVMSLDSWTRFRTEGYGRISVPYLPGSYDLKVHTWRPNVSDVRRAQICEMKRYFVGGTPELNDITNPGTVSESIMSYYGLQTTTTGTVSLRCNVINHCPLALSKKNGVHRYYSLMDRLSSASLFHSVSSVIEAFGHARERMLKATERFQSTKMEE